MKQCFYFPSLVVFQYILVLQLVYAHGTDSFGIYALYDFIDQVEVCQCDIESFRHQEGLSLLPPVVSDFLRPDSILRHIQL